MKKSELKALIREVIEEIHTNESWKGGAKAIGLAGAIAGIGAAGYYADKNVPRVEVGGQIARVVPDDNGKVPHKTAMKLKASDGKMYEVWSDKHGHYFAYPLEK
jgi:hypothetical protein